MREVFAQKNPGAMAGVVADEGNFILQKPPAS
jgi:hypothetical protein